MVQSSGIAAEPLTLTDVTVVDELRLDYLAPAIEKHAVDANVKNQGSQGRRNTNFFVCKKAS